jgi:hypothetical protein
MYHSPDKINDRPILSLCNPILLRVVWHCQLPLDPRLTEILEVIGGILSPIIRAQDLDLLLCLLLHLSLEILKPTEDLILGLHKEDPGFPRKVINEHRSTHIDPLTFECIRSNIPLGLLSLLGIVALTFFPSAHPLHTPYCSILNYGKLVTIPLRIDNAL